MGTIRICVGINQYQKFQLDKIVDSSEHIFGQQGTARNLPSYIPKLLEKLCISLDSLEPTSVAMGGKNLGGTDVDRGVCLTVRSVGPGADLRHLHKSICHSEPSLV
ncbi:anthrax toxin receptor 1-like [Choloepus didactylus]|uniref:anthrax toxin receptor 1-like n=1 Tax=Choloepus didactylus TaxID=27675 RepID=UPI0018A01E80|nr:anthrax toxin receptor 1-like [Choloepus didactylus]